MPLASRVARSSTWRSGNGRQIRSSWTPTVTGSIGMLPDASCGASPAQPESSRRIGPLRRRSCLIVHPLTDEPWGVRRFLVRDPRRQRDQHRQPPRRVAPLWRFPLFATERARRSADRRRPAIRRGQYGRVVQGDGGCGIGDHGWRGRCGVSLEGPVLRVATDANLDPISGVMRGVGARAVPGVLRRAPDGRAAAVHVAHVDPILVADGTYFVHEAGGGIVACGGWSRRGRLYAGSHDQEGDDRLLDPANEAAHIRAMLRTPRLDSAGARPGDPRSRA